jgi:hypothetical protein
MFLAIVLLHPGATGHEFYSRSIVDCSVHAERLAQLSHLEYFSQQRSISLPL